MDLVQRLQAQLKTVRLDKGHLEERCYLLEREVNGISRRGPSTTSSASLLPTLPAAPHPTTSTSARKREPLKHHHHHHHELRQLDKALAEERAASSGMRARLAKAEAQLKSRDKEVQSLQERLQKSQAALREAESKFLSDLSRLFKGSVHPEEDVGEAAKWERELGLALREVRKLNEEMAGFRAAGAEQEEKQREGKGKGTTATTRPMTGEKRATTRRSRSREEEKEWAHLQEKVVRQAERIHADKKVIKLIKKKLRRAQEQEGEWEEQLLGSQEAQKGLRVELASLAQRHEDLVNQLREQVEAMTGAQGLVEEGEEEGEGGEVEEGWVLVDVEREGEEGLRRRKKEKKERKERKAGRKHDEEVVHHHHRRHHHRHHRKEEKEEEETQQEAADQRHGRQHYHQHEKQEQQQQQQSSPQVLRRHKTKRGKTRASSLSTPPRAKPQAWEINFPPGKKEYELSPLIHRFETYEDGK
jgi:hypothetical protein